MVGRGKDRQTDRQISLLIPFQLIIKLSPTSHKEHSSKHFESIPKAHPYLNTDLKLQLVGEEDFPPSFLVHQHQQLLGDGLLVVDLVDLLPKLITEAQL